MSSQQLQKSTSCLAYVSLCSSSPENSTIPTHTHEPTYPPISQVYTPHTYLAREVTSEQYIPGGQVSVHETFISQVVHTVANLPTKPQQERRKILVFDSGKVAELHQVLSQIPSRHQLQHNHQLQ